MPPSGPKMAQNYQKRAPAPPWGTREGSVVQVDGQNQLGYCLACLLAVFGPVWPRNGVRWAQNGLIWAPNVSCGLKLKNGRISGYTDLIANPWTLSPRANPHLRWFPPLVLSCLGPPSTHAYACAGLHVTECARRSFGFHASEWHKRTATTGFCPTGARLATFWGILACACPPKRGQNGSKMTPKKILEHLGCL